MLDQRLGGTTVFTLPSGVEHSVYFHDGTPAKVRTGTMLEPLDRVLVDEGMLDEGTLRGTLMEVVKKNILHGRLLVMKGLLDREKVLHALRVQVLRKVTHLFELPGDTRYAYYKDENLITAYGGPELTPTEPLSVIMAGIRLMAGDPLVDATLAKIQGRPLALHLDAEMRRFQLTRDEQAVVDTIRTRRMTLRELVLANVAQERVVRQTVYALVVTRHLDLGVAAKPPVGLGRVPVSMGNPVGVPQTPPVSMGNPVGVPQTPPVSMGNPVGVPQTPPGAPTRLSVAPPPPSAPPASRPPSSGAAPRTPVPTSQLPRVTPRAPIEVAFAPSEPGGFGTDRAPAARPPAPPPRTVAPPPPPRSTAPPLEPPPAPARAVPPRPPAPPPQAPPAPSFTAPLAPSFAAPVPPQRTPVPPPPAFAAPVQAQDQVPPSTREAVPAERPEIAARRADIEKRAQGIDAESYYQMLAVTPESTPEQVKSAYFALAKSWHPDRLPRELVDIKPLVARVFARFSEAYQTLIDPAKGKEYAQLLQAGGGAPDDQEQVARVVDAAFEFQKAEILLKKNDVAGAEQLAAAAVQADPEQPEYMALLIWIRALRRGDPTDLREGQTSAHFDDLIKTLDGILAKEKEFERALYYRGVLLKRSGRTEKAIRDFRLAAQLNPKNLDAVREVRLYEMRKRQSPGVPAKEAPKAGEQEGLFGKFFKR